MTYPELYEMQVEAIMTSVFNLKKEGITSQPEIMIPLVSTVEEFTTLKSQLVSTIQDLENDMKDKVHYLI
ncbi:putative PEP-binding protein, partial [Brevibacterium casei]|uniref:putative PEP-binding protein n=1 Tax=Brevibacterium casei TaxID=33889 RepID=UPI0020D1419D